MNVWLVGSFLWTFTTGVWLYVWLSGGTWGDFVVMVISAVALLANVNAYVSSKRKINPPGETEACEVVE